MTKPHPLEIPQSPDIKNAVCLAPAPSKRQYRRRSITTGPGTKLVMEQEQKLAEARKIAKCLNDIGTLMEWGCEQVMAAVKARMDFLDPKQN